MKAAAGTKLVYDFAEGSREMRELLGGKGANVAEMTRVLGPERVLLTPACGFATFADNPIASAEVAEGKLTAMAVASARLRERHRL